MFGQNYKLYFLLEAKFFKSREKSFGSYFKLIHLTTLTLFVPNF